MDIEKINMQMTIEEIDNTCQVGKCFEDRTNLKYWERTYINL